MEMQPSLEEFKQALRLFQIRRLEKTYKDLQNISQYQKAYNFFFQQLYLPNKGFTTPSVSADITLPSSIETFLDKRIIFSLRKAAKLQKKIEDIDFHLAKNIFLHKIDPNQLNLAVYQKFYKELDNYEERIDQFMLMGEVVKDLYAISQIRLLRFALEVGRKLVGKHPLLQLAEGALSAYKDIKNIDFLIESIEYREIEFHNALWNNDFPEKYKDL